MDRDEIKRELGMTYIELCNYLIKKYGPAQYDYFHTEECKSKNKKISRTKEGIFCHHIREDYGGNLSEEFHARSQSFQWQKKENLVYCNYIEHFILHIKIGIIRQSEFYHKPIDIHNILAGGGSTIISGEIDECFFSDKCSYNIPEWKIPCFDVIRDNYSDYIDIINAVIIFVENHYDGEKNEENNIQVGKFIEFKDYKAPIIEIDEGLRYLALQYKDGNIEKIKTATLCMYFNYKDIVEYVLKRFCTDDIYYFDDMYKDILSRDKKSAIEYAKLLEVDFKIKGYPQFRQDKLVKDEYGSYTIEEYLNKGLPSSFGKEKDEIIISKPTFWKGEIPEKIINDDKYNYIVRAYASFSLKDGKTPFYRYKGYQISPERMVYDDDNNLVHKKGYILSDSQYYDFKTKKYYSKVRDSKGNIVPAGIVITIAKSDLEKFKEVYNIEFFRIHDGCYWKIIK